MFTAMMKQLGQRAQFARIRALTSNFRLNTRGNVAVITAVAMLPMVAAIGCVIDYTDASMIKTKLQAAADAAALGTVSVNSSVVTTAKAMSSGGTVSGGSTFANAFFNANLSTSPENVGYTSLTPTSTVTLTGTTMTAKVSFTANVPTYFLGVLGRSNIAVSGSSTASYTLPTYINFYLMVDVSGSMSMPSTAAEQARLMAVNPDNLQGSPGYPQGCQFACHFAAQGACAQTSAQGNPVPRPHPCYRFNHEPRVGWILPRIYHLQTGDDPDIIFIRQQYKQRQYRELDRYAGFFLLHAWNDVLHPATRRCRRLCGDDLAVHRLCGRAGDQSI